MQVNSLKRKAFTLIELIIVCVFVFIAFLICTGIIALILWLCHSNGLI